MFARLAHLMYRRAWTVIAIWAVLLIVAGILASQVGQVLGPGSFHLNGSQSQLANSTLERTFHQNTEKVALVLVHSPSLTVSDPAFRRTVAAVAAQIRADRALHASFVDNPLLSRNAQFISGDRHSAVVAFQSTLSETRLEDQVDPLRALLHIPGYTTYVMGTAPANHDYSVALKNDLNKGEFLALGVCLIILFLVFGSLVGGILPLILAAFSITLSLGLVFIFGHVIDTSIYVENVVTLLGLGICIDYSLFIVYRFREELADSGNDVEQAVVRTMQTTGRAVFFSGLTVAIGLASLILTGLTFMQAMGLGGMVVPFTALAVTMTLLPAILSLLGTKVNSIRIVPVRFLHTDDRGLWHRITMTIMRRPLLSGGLVLLILLALAFPTTHLNQAFGSLKNAPPGLESVEGYLYMRDHFTTNPDSTQVVLQHAGSGTLVSPNSVAALQTLETELRRDPEVVSVTGPTDLWGRAQTSTQARALLSRFLSPDHQTGVISVVPRHETGTKAAGDLVKRIRQDVVPYAQGSLRGTTIRVGGSQANYTDFNDAMLSKFPLIVAIVVVLSYIFLFFAFRSVFLPLKAVLLNLLSVGASFGMLELVFQQGVGSGLLGFSPESGVATWVPIFLFTFLFGLSMDYEVFLLSRIRERWLQTGDNEESVAFGLEKTGRLITSAALIMMVAFSGFIIGHEIQLKEFGFGMVAAVAVDASLIRIVLVPSIMKVMGRWNWWMPSFLSGLATHSSAPDEASVKEEREPELAHV